ncbi:hypothetical protein [Saccharomonospora xinjiangensis]|uniref:Uncharacterized protein n=1 Tax=Saccharomonospora xinjiangensis XJ-54 TaxID=882086 RepID=I0UZQ3_9PSEU|nr:hypothetical protein [Saccharomonospora xinjiangensis]EID53356.1 hypothetical protein SacxiDRAFT_1097 [Saccharomonospora xinjiangensis XJ-54]
MSSRDGREPGWSLSRVSWREWLGLAAGLLAVVALVLPWTRLSASDPEVSAALAELPRADVHRSVWRATFLGWLAPLLVAVAGVSVVLFGQRPALRRDGLPHLWLVAAGVAACATALAWVFLDWQFGEEQRTFLAESGVAVEAAFGRYLGAAAVLVSLVAATLDVRAAVSRGPNRRRAGAR